MLRQKAVASEIIIRILDCPLKREFTACSHVLLVVTNRTTVSSLKRKIQGVTGIPSNRIMLLLCGEVLRDDKAFLPPEVMEPIGFITSDEDEIKFRPRIHMKTLESPEGEDDEQSAPDQDDGHIPLDDGEGVESEQNVVEKKKRKKVAQHNPFESFHLEGELKKVGCEKFAKALTDAGYGNEGSFAHIHFEDLQEAGVWIPKGPALRILELSARVREKLGEMDRSVTTLAEEVENEMRQEQRLKPITLEGDQSGNQYLKKADLRRSWQRARLEKMKQAQMKEREELEPSRKISDDLEGRIDRIKKRCMEEQSVSDPDFDNITGLLYSSERRQHHYLRDSASPNKAKMKRPEVLRIVAAKMKVAVSTSLAPLKVDDSGAGERDRSEVMDVKKAGPSVPCCCPKHREVISTRRERLIERRRLTNGLELLVQLERLPTFAKGHVRTSTLITLMKRKLLEYFSNPPRAADATLPEQCVLAAQLSVREQKRVLYWRQRQELTRENFGGVLPVQFFHPLKFIDAFVDALEQLDRQRLDGSAFSRS